MKPDKPFVIRLPNPFGGELEVVRGREEYAAVERLFDRLPADDRAGPELLTTLFGPPGGELLLPVELKGVSGFPGGLILATGNGGLFVRDSSSRWRYVGECPGWFPVVAGDRVYSYVNAAIWSRPLADPAAGWEKWCDQPPLEPGERGGILFLAAGRLHLTVDPGFVCSRPLADPAVGWTRVGSPASSNGLAAAGETLFGNDGKRMYARAAADPTAAWAPAGPWPDGCHVLAADGDRLLALGRTGPVHARPVKASPDSPWTVVGRIHDPYKQ